MQIRCDSTIVNQLRLDLLEGHVQAQVARLLDNVGAHNCTLGSIVEVLRGEDIKLAGCNQLLRLFNARAFTQ